MRYGGGEWNKEVWDRLGDRVVGEGSRYKRGK